MCPLELDAVCHQYRLYRLLRRLLRMKAEVLIKDGFCLRETRQLQVATRVAKPVLCCSGI